MNKMNFKRNTAGGGSATNATGLTFEEYIDHVFSNQINESDNVSLDGSNIIKMVMFMQRDIQSMIYTIGFVKDLVLDGKIDYLRNCFQMMQFLYTKQTLYIS